MALQPSQLAVDVWRRAPLRTFVLAWLLLCLASASPSSHAAALPGVHRQRTEDSTAFSPTGFLRLYLAPQVGQARSLAIASSSSLAAASPSAAPVPTEEQRVLDLERRRRISRAFERSWLASGLGLGMAAATTFQTWRSLRNDQSQQAMNLRWGVAAASHIFFPAVLATIVNPAPLSTNLLGSFEGGLLLLGSAAVGAFVGGVVVVLEVFAWGYASLIIWESAFDLAAIVGPTWVACFWTFTALGYLGSSFGIPWRVRRWAKQNPEALQAKASPTILLDGRRAVPGVALSLRF